MRCGKRSFHEPIHDDIASVHIIYIYYASTVTGLLNTSETEGVRPWQFNC